jgi:hypothetical protein
VSSLPPSPFIGQTVSFKAAEGVYWNLLYTKESTEYPWNKIGGPPLNAASNTARELNNTAYTSLPMDPLKITAPLKGDYDIEIQGKLNQGGVSQVAWLSYAVGATAANDNWASELFVVGANAELDTCKKTRQTALAASAVIEEKAKCGGAYVCTFGRRRLWVDPVRVG